MRRRVLGQAPGITYGRRPPSIHVTAALTCAGPQRVPPPCATAPDGLVASSDEAPGGLLMTPLPPVVTQE